MLTFNLNKTHTNSAFELDVTFDLNKGDFLSIYGESGAGKTTILRLIAGLDAMHNGHLKNNDTIWFDSSKQINLKPQLRKVGFVFQDNSLFPNMTVLENLEFALKKGQSKSIVFELISSFGIEDLVNRNITSLSGGQQQKVALARAIVQKPSILLLDEPLSAIDDENRHMLQDLLLKIHHQYELTTILVSHNVSEIFKLSNKVLKIKAGKIEKSGTPKEIFTSNTNSNQITLIGTVLDLEYINEVYTILIQSNNGIVKQVVSKVEFSQYKIGELIEISLSGFQTSIQKVKIE
jgi:molybdate transport system ATP-binding protein